MEEEEEADEHSNHFQLHTNTSPTFPPTCAASNLKPETNKLPLTSKTTHTYTIQARIWHTIM